MKGQAYIKLSGEEDSAYVDIYTEYGVTLTRGWREEILKPTAMKSYIQNTSRLEDGIRMVASKNYAKVDSREISLSMILKGSDETDYLTKYENFLNKIAFSGLIYLKIPVMKRIFKVVYSDCSKYGDYGLKIGNFTLKFTEPNPKDRDTI